VTAGDAGHKNPLALLARRDMTQQKCLYFHLFRNSRNICGIDLQEEGGRKAVVFSEPKESQLRMLDSLANQVAWRSPDGYLRLCYKLFKASRPRNSREVTRLRLTLESMLAQQREHAMESV
jgi:hypothetical protein